MATANFSTHELSLLLGTSDGTFETEINFAVRVFPTSLACGDFDGDGVDDLVATNINSDTASVLINQSVIVGDLNLDGVVNLLRRPNHHTIKQVLGLSGNRIQFKRIKDQNRKDQPNSGWHSGQNWEPWQWLKQHRDPNVAWLWESMKKHKHNKADISDAGMLYFLMTGDEAGNPAKFESFIGGGIPIDESRINNNSNQLKASLRRQEAVRSKREKLMSLGDLVIIEAEEFSLAGGWSVEESPFASGGKFLRFNGKNHYQSVADIHKLSVQLQIPQAGTYTVKWSMRQPSQAEGDKSNDIWISFPDAKQKGNGKTITGFHKFFGRSKGRFGMNGQIETHHKHSWLNVEFPKPGVYSIQISGRSELLEADQFILYRNMSFEDARELVEM